MLCFIFDLFSSKMHDDDDDDDNCAVMAFILPMWPTEAADSSKRRTYKLVSMVTRGR